MFEPACRKQACLPVGRPGFIAEFALYMELQDLWDFEEIW